VPFLARRISIAACQGELVVRRAPKLTGSMIIVLESGAMFCLSRIFSALGWVDYPS
jgi:hypothetical protein